MEEERSKELIIVLNEEFGQTVYKETIQKNWTEKTSLL